MFGLSPERRRIVLRIFTSLVATLETYISLHSLKVFPTEWALTLLLLTFVLWITHPPYGRIWTLLLFGIALTYISLTAALIYVAFGLLLSYFGLLRPQHVLMFLAIPITLMYPKLAFLLFLLPLAAILAYPEEAALLAGTTVLVSLLLMTATGRSEFVVLSLPSLDGPAVSPPTAAMEGMGWIGERLKAFPDRQLISHIFGPILRHPPAITAIVLWGFAAWAGAAWRIRRLRAIRSLVESLGITAVMLVVGHVGIAHFLAKESVQPDIGRMFGLIIPAYFLALVVGISTWDIPGTTRGEQVGEKLAPRKQMTAVDAIGQSLSPVAIYESWEDLVGINDIKEELLEAARARLDPRRRVEYERYGIRPPRGILLYGPPGTGKTKLVGALAKKLGVHLIAVAGTEFASKWYGETEENLRKLFEAARAAARPTILFFDEIEAVLPQRGKIARADAPEKNIVATFLAYADGLHAAGNVLLMAATNHPELMDEAVLRPGRFDRLMYIGPPSREARRKMLEKYLPPDALAGDIDLDKVAAKMERFTGADIEALCADVLFRVRIKEGRQVTMHDLEDALKRYKPTVTIEMLKEYERLSERYRRGLSRSPDETPVERVKVTWDDVVGLEQVKEALREAVELPLKHPDLLKQYGIQPPRGVLMFGPPGCGKTFLAKAVAGSAEAYFINASAAEIQTDDDVRRLFVRARENIPCVLFIDEIDALTESRFSGISLSSRIVTEFLTQMDGLEELKGVVVIGATNRPDVLDPALLRPGRFERVIYVPPPDLPARMELFRRLLASRPVAADVNIDQLAEMAEGYTAADIRSLCDRIALKAVKAATASGELYHITMADMVEEIRRTPRSVAPDMLSRYERLREQLER